MRRRPLDFSSQLVLLKTVAHSLKILHDLHIVHSDLGSRSPPPVRRAINREPVIEEEWPYDDDLSFRMIPVPGGCGMVGPPRGRR